MAPPIRFRAPCALDGAKVHQLIAECAPLDINSRYCNLLQCSHFADTCVLAECQDEVVGFVSAYRKPAEPHTLFVWQIAVAPNWRGKGVATHLLNHLLQRPALLDIRFIESTITPANQASSLLFKKFAEKRRTELHCSILFSRAEHFAGEHADETLFRIGPF